MGDERKERADVLRDGDGTGADSAQKRGLTLPDSEEAGKRFGELVKEIAKADHDQLLYVVVDKAVQQVGTKSGS